jgi:hypothetical protein
MSPGTALSDPLRRDTPIFGELSVTSGRPIIKSVHISHMLHSINIEQPEPT